MRKGDGDGGVGGTGVVSFLSPVTAAVGRSALPGVRRVVYGKYPGAFPVRQLHGPKVCL
jgi:hypothetical protein